MNAMAIARVFLIALAVGAAMGVLVWGLIVEARCSSTARPARKDGRRAQSRQGARA